MPASRARPLRVLLVEEAALVRAGLARLVGGLAERVETIEASSVAEAVRVLKAKAPDLILTELPGDGAAALRRLRRAAGKTPIVVVSQRDRPEDVRLATGAGAQGLIPKSSSPGVLLAALKLVLSGGIYLPPKLLDAPARQAPPRGFAEPATPFAHPELTPRQRQVVTHLGEGKSNRQIADALGLSPGTVKIHMTRIFKTLGVKSRTQALLATQRWRG